MGYISIGNRLNSVVKTSKNTLNETDKCKETGQWMYLVSDFSLFAILSGKAAISVIIVSQSKTLPSLLQLYMGKSGSLYSALCSCKISTNLCLLRNSSRINTHLFNLKLGLKYTDDKNWELQNVKWNVHNEKTLTPRLKTVLQVRIRQWCFKDLKADFFS